MVVGALLGVAAVARIGDRPAIESLRGDTRSTGGRGWRRAQQGLVALQMALALALLLAAALTGESLIRLRRVDIGFAPAKASTFTAVLPFSGYSRYQLTAAFHFRVMESLEAIPGVTGVAAAMQVPLMPELAAAHQQLVGGARAGVAEMTARANVVSANYFGVMGIPIRVGRTFMRGDLVNPNPGVVLSVSLARELFGTVDVVGEEVRIANSRSYPAYHVVGVVGDVYGERIPDGVMRVLYFPLLPGLLPASTDMPRIPYNPSVHYVVRSAEPLGRLLPAFRGVVASIDARVPVMRATTLDAVVSDATARARLTTLLLALAAAATLLLGAVGLYSVIAYAVAGRAPEFAVRLALGATAPEIVGLVLREGALLASIGLAAGTALSLGSARFIRGVLYEVSATNPVTYLAAGILLGVTALLAMYLPARRAGKTDPAQVLRA